MWRVDARRCVVVAYAVFVVAADAAACGAGTCVFLNGAATKYTALDVLVF